MAASLPPEQAHAVQKALVETPATEFLLGGVERLSAMSLHIACSLIVLAGIVHGRKLVAWLGAVILHGLFNLAAALWVDILRSQRAFPQQGVAPRARPAGPQFS